MNLRTVRVEVENDTQTRIVMAILIEMGAGELPSHHASPKAYTEAIPMEVYGATRCVGSDRGDIATWSPSHGKTISFEKFMVEASKITKLEPEIGVGEYVVEFKDGGVQVGCTFVPCEVVDQIHARLHNI